MELFSFPKPSASTEMKNLGFIDGTGEIVIYQTIYFPQTGLKPPASSRSALA